MKHRNVAAGFVIILSISLVQFAATDSYSQSRRIDPSARADMPAKTIAPVDQTTNDCPSGLCNIDSLTQLTTPELLEEDHEGCDPSYRPALAPPPQGANLGEPTIAPPRPTPIHPMTSRFDAPIDHTEIVQVSVTMESTP